MMTNDTPVLSLTDVDEILPAGYEILASMDSSNVNNSAVRTVRCTASAETLYFFSAQEYFKFAMSVAPRRRLADAQGTRYIEVSARYDDDPYFHASVTHTIAALTRSRIILHRMKSDETSVRFVLTQEEMAVLVEAYRSYLNEGDRGRATPDVDPLLDAPDEIA